MDSVKGPSVFDRFMVWLMPRMTPAHVWAYRRFDGRYGNTTTGGGPVLVITTVGRKTGQDRSVALGFFEDAKYRYVVGSNGGKSSEPNWALNLKANPLVEIQVGSEVTRVHAELLDGDIRDDAWRRFTETYPDYSAAESWSGRTFPLFRLPKEEAKKSEEEST